MGNNRLSIQHRIRRSVAYESCRWLLRQVRKETHYPPPVLERVAYQPFRLVEKSLYYRGARSTDNLMLPQFLGIGAMKSGTSWLWGQLDHHPEVYVPHQKELHYFSWHFHRSLNYYASLLEPGAGKVAGEISVDYALLTPARIRFIHRVLPDARLLYIMRNPIDRAWSHAKQELLFRTGRRYEEVRPFEFIRRFHMSQSRRLGDYLQTIDNWTSIYPREQLWLGFYDDIKARPRELMTEVFQHIGVSSEVDWEGFPIQEVFRRGEKTPPIPDQYREVLEAIYAGSIERMYERFGERVASWRCGQKAPVAASAA